MTEIPGSNKELIWHVIFGKALMAIVAEQNITQSLGQYWCLLPAPKKREIRKEQHEDVYLS